MREQAARLIPADRQGKSFVLMANFGEYRAEDLPECDGTSVDGLRVAFHKKDMAPALELCARIQDKGYRVYLQPMVSLSYSDAEFLDLIRRANDLRPYAFYIVDSFGVMKGKELTRLFYMTEHSLNGGIWIGFHSHNNMQLAYSNAQRLLTAQTRRNLIIDACVYGMGRGAGNLNTELFVEYLNENAEGDYNLKPLLGIIDEVLDGFYRRNYWGYSLPNYISAVHNAHPNYAGYLDEKHTLTVENMNDIFDMMDEDKKASYDKDYIEALYRRYMEGGKIQEEHKAELGRRLEGRRVLLIAPGRSSVEERDKIAAFSKAEDVVTVSVNFDYDGTETDYIFISNLRRFRELDAGKRGKCIVTSNIPAHDVYLHARYGGLVNADEVVRDNAGLMAIKFLMNCGVREIALAGFDGYSHDAGENYGDSRMAIIMRNATFDAMNEGIARVLAQYAKKVSLTFLTVRPAGLSGLIG